MVVMFVVIIYIIGDFFGVLIYIFCYVLNYFIILNYIDLFGSGLDFSVFCYIFVYKKLKGLL